MDWHRPNFRPHDHMLPSCLHCMAAPVVTINLYLESRQHVYIDGEYGVLGTGICIGCGAMHAMALTASLDLHTYRHMPDGKLSSVMRKDLPGLYDLPQEERAAYLASFVRLVDPNLTRAQLGVAFDWLGVTTEEDLC